ncbi:unnamed protein product [Polarella glacialis]|uniref:Uncharacterized protein n=1 Tax=Polarella glacialis TaxID=89957 RepID=A0A813LE29_POLGL|nr:unnamed protein product [Polarella glacialis]
MKRWRPVDAPPSNGEASLDDWKAHPRLQKHLLRFLHSPDPGRVLSRYSAQAQNSNPEKLLRIAVHVGAWVALLPLGQAAASPSGKEEDVSQPSPVQLLAQILRLRGRAKITDWLQGVLHLVAHRLQDVRSNIQGQAAAPWIELRRSMPKTIWRELRTQRPAIPVCGGSKGQQELAHQGSLLKMQTPPEQSKPAVPRGKVEAEAVLQVSDPGIEALAASDFHFEISELGSKKALRGFYRDGAAFSNANLEERVLHVNGLEEQLVKAVSSESWDQVCSLIREAAATLAAPRQKAALSEPAVPMPEDAQDRLQANLQSKLRRLICRGLGCLDLSDAGTASQLEPALCFMKLLIERFKVRGQLEEARAAKQWMLLQGFITAEATTKAGASLGNSLIEDSCRTDDAFIRKGKVIWSGEDRGSSKDGVYIPGVKVKSNPLKRWRPVVAPPGNAEVTVEDWKTHPRLQKHVQRFLGSPDPGRVLSRYSAQAQNVNPEKLLRIAVHVGAWVALLPLEHAATAPSGEEEDVSQSSPVQLLAQILRLRGRTKITDWLQGVLRGASVQGQAAVPWIKLRRSMPKAIWRELRTQRPAIPVCGESKGQQELAPQGAFLKMHTPPEQTWPAVPRAAVEAESDMLQQVSDPGTEALAALDFHFEISELGGKKVARCFYRDGAAFSNANLEERALHLDGLEERLVKAVSSESWDRVCSLIREAAAALAAPRQKAVLNETAALMLEDAQERLQANFQGRLRKLIYQGLGYLDLTDEGTAIQLEPALSFIKLLLERFEIRGQLEEARAAKQWLRLQGILTADATTEAGANLGSLRPVGSCVGEVARISESKKTLKGPDMASSKSGLYTPSTKIQGNPLVRNSGLHVILTCNRCGVELRSSWVFENREKVLALTPQNGHLPCGGKYVPVDAQIGFQRDSPSHLDICPHGVGRSHCVKCGGSSICVHKKQRSRCRHCVAAGYSKRARTKRPDK